jgi:serine/threonine protein kinase
MLVRASVTDYRCIYCSGSLQPLAGQPAAAPSRDDPEAEAGQRQPSAHRPGDVVRRYRFLSYLGRGAYGEVWRAEDTDLRRQVALKILTYLDPEEVERFHHEARSAAALDHENIAPVYEIFESTGRHYIAMKFLEGKTLDEAGLSVPALLESTYLVARAIGYAHRRGIVHRDIKPKNIIVEHSPDRPDYRIFVVDFGLALAIDELAAELGHIVGTPGFMSPEQAAGEVATPLSDVYSLGATLYCVLTGDPPFNSPDVDEVLRLVKEKEPPKLRIARPDLHPALEALIESALAKDPRRRPASALDFGEELRSLLDTGRVYYTSPSTLPNEVRSVFAELRRGFGKYIVVSTLGENAVGPVFKAWDTSLQRFVAVRVMEEPQTAEQKELMERMMRDVRVAAALRHPSIPQIFEIGQIKNRYYLSRAYVEGASLPKLKPPPLDVARHAQHVAQAVHYAHGEGIVHGNITPETVIVDTQDRALIVEFGLGGIVDERLSYVPPEGALTPKADVFGLGVTMYETMLPEPPMRKEIQEIATAGRLKPLENGVPGELWEIVRKAADVLPSARYGSALELSLALERFIADQSNAGRAKSKPKKK